MVLLYISICRHGLLSFLLVFSALFVLLLDTNEHPQDDIFLKRCIAQVPFVGSRRNGCMLALGMMEY
jgi:hypothetical protein